MWAKHSTFNGILTGLINSVCLYQSLFIVITMTFDTWRNTWLAQILSQLFNLIAIWWLGLWMHYKITLTHFLLTLEVIWNHFPCVDVFFWPDLCSHGYSCGGGTVGEWKTWFLSMLEGTVLCTPTICVSEGWQWSLPTCCNLTPKVRLCSALENSVNHSD